MLKLGVCTPEQLTGWQRRWRKGLISASLLQVSDPPTEADSFRFEAIMPSICLSSGVARTTARQRFTSLDQEVNRLLEDVLIGRSTIYVEDCAVSNGITAAEWFSSLSKFYPRIRFTASDRTLFLIEVTRKSVGDKFILEPDGTPIQYIRAPFVLSLVQPQRWIFPVNRVIQRRALNLWHESISAELSSGLKRAVSEDALETQYACFGFRRLSLIHPEVKQLCGARFRVQQHSIFEPLPQPVDVIRTMNVLNRAYFSDAQVRCAAKCIQQSLNNGGVWIVGRTISEQLQQHEVTVLQKNAGGWDVLHRIGGGSEVEELVHSSDSLNGWDRE